MRQGLSLQSCVPNQLLKETFNVKRCGLVNLQSTCYMNTVFQFLRVLIGDRIC